MPITILELPVPADLDAPDAWLLHGLVDVTHEVLLDTWGNRDHHRTAAETLVGLRAQQYERKLRLVAVASDVADPSPAAVLGYAVLDLPMQDNTHTGWLDVGVRPAHRGRGIGAALHDAGVERARRLGRTTLVASTGHRQEPDPGPGALAPSTGSGRVPAGDLSVRFVRARGWQLEQVARYSVLDLPVDPAVLAAHRTAAEAVAGPDYRLVTWQDRCPEAWVEQFALLETRMSTDPPSGGLDVEEDRWDAARIRTTEQVFADRGLTFRVTAAEHVPTGTLAAFTALISPAAELEAVHQHDTLVLREHRGRRLGMLVKVANLQRLAVEQPGARRIGTWNAQENEHMLAINVALGFRPAGGSGEWQLRL
ncbi:hypothetical protein AGMMS50218_12860 [Actinomycetota bacterium]|nr:hypothetical protein AGMMS50218_12860 [Actinomycetota bacterium]